MRKTFVSLCAVVLLSLGAFAQKEDVTQPIHQMITGFNTNDMKLVAAQYATGDISIIDEVPPFRWTGAKANDAWLADLEKYDKEAGVSDAKVKLGSITRTETGSETAYVVAAVSYNFQQKGKAMTESAHMTFALRKEGGSWKIASWVWSGNKPHEAKASIAK